MDKELAIHSETERCKSLIKLAITNIEGKCYNLSTIEESNKLFRKTIIKAKKEAFDSIKTVVKPYVIYRVNQYFYECLK